MKNPNTWYSNIGWFCLLGDGVTGFMLLVAPLFTLKMMGVEDLPLEPVFVRYLGVFVLSVGLFYIVPRIFDDITECAMVWQTIFVCTGVLRSFIALFVLWAFGRGLLDSGWLTVSAYDASLSALQFWVLRRTATS